MLCITYILALDQRSRLVNKMYTNVFILILAWIVEGNNTSMTIENIKILEPVPIGEVEYYL